MDGPRTTQGTNVTREETTSPEPTTRDPRDEACDDLCQHAIRVSCSVSKEQQELLARPASNGSMQLKFGNCSYNATRFKYDKSPRKPNPLTFMGLPPELRRQVFEDLARSIPDEGEAPASAVDYIRNSEYRFRSPWHLQGLSPFEGWLVKNARAPYRINRACNADDRAARLVERWAVTLANETGIPKWRLVRLLHLLTTQGLLNT